MKRIIEIGNSAGYIAKDGKTDYKIVIKEDADECTVYSAEELKRLIHLASGADIEITNKVCSPSIRLGFGKKLTIKDVTRNGFTIKTEGKDVFIDAPTKTAVLFGVYRFLEYVAGYMFYAMDKTKIGDAVEFKELNVLDFPDFLNRDIYSHDTIHNPDYERRLFSTGGNYSANAPKYGEGSWWSSLWDQSLCDQLLNYKVYYDKYPEWYYNALKDQGGMRLQLCYTKVLYDRDEYEKGDFNEPNYDDGRHGAFWTLVYNLITKYIAVETDKSVFQLGMNDNDVFCTCERCQQDAKKYGQSGVAIRFTNAVADEVEKWRKENCPEREIYLTMFAYYALFDAPVKLDEKTGEYVPLDDSVIVRDNVIIRYTPMSGYYMFPLDDMKENESTAKSILGWSKVCKHFATWDYRIDFYAYFAPFPQWMAAEQTMKMYYKYGFIDVMYQGCTDTGGTPFVALDNYVRARFSWDTSLDYDKLTDDFIENYYEEGADAIREYRAFLTEHYKKLNKENGYKAFSHFCVTKRWNYPIECIKHIEEIFKKGYDAIEKIKESEPERYEDVKRRLDSESIFYRFMKVGFYPEHYTKQERLDEIKNIEVIAKKTNMTRMCNGKDFMFNVIHILRLPLEEYKGQIEWL